MPFACSRRRQRHDPGRGHGRDGDRGFEARARLEHRGARERRDGRARSVELRRGTGCGWRERRAGAARRRARWHEGDKATLRLRPEAAPCRAPIQVAAVGQGPATERWSRAARAASGRYQTSGGNGDEGQPTTVETTGDGGTGQPAVGQCEAGHQGALGDPGPYARAQPASALSPRRATTGSTAPQAARASRGREAVVVEAVGVTRPLPVPRAAAAARAAVAARAAERGRARARALRFCPSSRA